MSKRLYELIQGRGPLAFNVLCKTLDETQNNPARSLLKATKNIKYVLKIIYLSMCSILKVNTGSRADSFGTKTKTLVQIICIIIYLYNIGTTFFSLLWIL